MEIGGWFLGPKLENIIEFSDLVRKAYLENANFRRQPFPTDPLSITNEMKEKESYKRQLEHLEKELELFCKEMKRSTNFASCRWQALSNSDKNMPAALGYTAALLYSCNNLSEFGGPATIPMELEVGNQLCEMLGYDLKGDVKPFGYLTGGGTAANIESILASLSVKLYPLTVQSALRAIPSISGHKIHIPELDIFKDEQAITTWELMNLETDDILNIPSHIQGAYGNELLKTIENYSVRRLGLCNFINMNGLSELPVIISSSMCHYSIGKALSILGLGDSNLVKIPVDEDGRMQIIDLERQLKKCVDKQIPVLSVIATVGTTEGGSVDPVDEIVKLQMEYRKKGLSFSIHVDAAFGGYFASMLKGGRVSNNDCQCPQGSNNYNIMSDYVRRQYQDIRFADTVTLDPHKTGFVPYPAGALCCRNESLVAFIKFDAPYIIAKATKCPGMIGITGSKPGAAAASVVLAHRVIGLNRYGFGRILEQCSLAGKMMYCKWLTLANKDDSFICMPLKPLPRGMTLQFAKDFINKNIKGKSLKEIITNEEALEFLKAIGSDTSINVFAFNSKINEEMNHNLDFCNELNLEIHHRLAPAYNKTDINRKPFFLGHTVIKEESCVIPLHKLKESLQISGEGGLDVLINTVMNPWIIHTNRIEALGEAVRETVVTSIGLLTDKPDFHRFVAVGPIKDNTVFCEYLDASLDDPSHQYQAIIKIRFCNESESKKVQQKQNEQLTKLLSERKPIIIQNEFKSVLGRFISTETGDPCTVNCYLDQVDNEPFLSQVQVVVADVPYFKPLNLGYQCDETVPDYFMYGDQERVHLTHKVSRNAEFIQIIGLASSCDIPESLIQWGLDVYVSKFLKDDKDSENQNCFHKTPLITSSYKIKYNGINGLPSSTALEINTSLYEKIN